MTITELAKFLSESDDYGASLVLDGMIHYMNQKNRPLIQKDIYAWEEERRQVNELYKLRDEKWANRKRR